MEDLILLLQVYGIPQHQPRSSGQTSKGTKSKTLLQLLFLQNKWFGSEAPGMKWWYGSGFSEFTEPSSCLRWPDITSLGIWNPSALTQVFRPNQWGDKEQTLLQLLFLQDNWFGSATLGIEQWYGSGFSKFTQPCSCLSVDQDHRAKPIGGKDLTLSFSPLGQLVWEPWVWGGGIGQEQRLKETFLYVYLKNVSLTLSDLRGKQRYFPYAIFTGPLQSQSLYDWVKRPKTHQ